MASVYKRTRDNGRKGGAWYISFSDEHGQRRMRKGFTDKRETERMANQIEDEIRKRRLCPGLAIEERIAEQNKRRIGEHSEDYIEDCRHAGQSRVHVANKRRQLELLVQGTKAKRLSDLTPAAVGSHLQAMSARGKSARTVNQHRCTAKAFMAWCVRQQRFPENALGGDALAKQDEELDRRRVRRAMTTGELDWMLRTAPAHRRRVYLTAYWTGLRRNELKSITWADVDLERGAVRVRYGVGKARRDDEVPLRAEIVSTLADIRPDDPPIGQRVFDPIPRIQTFRRDLEHARAAWIDAADDDAERQQREKSDTLRRFDAEGRQLDMHALRTSLGTHLAQAGVMPQVARRIMRHSDVRITMKHYTDLRLRDDATAIESVPSIPDGAKPSAESEQTRATGTDGADSGIDLGIALASISDRKVPFHAVDSRNETPALQLADDTGDDAQAVYNPADTVGCRTMPQAEGVTSCGTETYGPLAQLASALV